MLNANIQVKKGLVNLSVFLWCAFLWSCCDDKSDGNYSMNNQEFIARVSSANSFGLSAGVMAASKGQSNAVKQYGEHIVNDYTTAKSAFKDLATQKNWSITTEMMANDLAKLSVLDKLSGIYFDREYAKMMATSHQETINLFTKASAANGVPDVDLRVMAAAKIRIFSAYLEEANSLQNIVSQ